MRAFQHESRLIDTGNDDVSLGSLRGAFWCLLDRAEFQYSHPGAATMFLRTLSCELGAMFEIRPVSDSSLWVYDCSSP